MYIRLNSDNMNNNHTINWFDMNGILGNYVDIDLMKWLIWLFTPVIITFILPIIIILLFYTSALIVHIYKHRYKIDLIKEAYKSGDYWKGAILLVASLWDAHGWIWHGYQVDYLDNIPDEGSALIVYYHGTLPVDYYYLASRIYLKKNRLVRAVVDRFLFSVPGLKLLFQVLKILPGTLKTCKEILDDGLLLSISPGGVREALFGDNYYRLIWGNRTGFAKVALSAKVPIIPVFTVNLREAFRPFGSSWFKKIYEKTRLPIVPIYGGFPVKLTTVIGRPIPYDPNLTPEQLADKTAKEIEKLIRQNQRIPGSILRATFDRVRRSPKKLI